STINEPSISYGPTYNLDSDYDCFTKAVSLGLWDYMRKSKSNGFVLSLSGGADSSAVACLVHSMIICAYNEFGDQLNDILKTSCDLSLPIKKRIQHYTRAVLTCVYQRTDNSSAQTEASALLLAKTIGAKFHTIDVQSIVDNYISLSQNIIGREMTWEQDDIALQNIQARSRAPSVWMLANIKGALLLSTSNRSEAAVGYATMDGDTCGGLSPI